MRRIKKRLVSILIAFVMVAGMLPIPHVHAVHSQCDKCGEVYEDLGIEYDDRDDYHYDHHDKVCDNCNECYGAAEMCPEGDHHMCGGEEAHFCAGGHCWINVADDGLECPLNDGGYGCDGADQNVCFWCHGMVDVCCSVCPLAGDFESHLCPDHGECPVEAGCTLGHDYGLDFRVFTCLDCGHCFSYSWENCDYEGCSHDCPCQCRACDYCGLCTDLTDPCDTCDALCGCICDETRCQVCGLCEDASDYEMMHCSSCGLCFDGEVEYCEDAAWLCEAIEGGTICKECNDCEYCDSCGWCIQNGIYEDFHCDYCDACHVSEWELYCEEHDQCGCICEYCDSCGEHLGDEEFSNGSHCEACMSCAEGSEYDDIFCPYCGDCGFCSGCFDEGGSCDNCEACVGGGNLDDEHCEECGECFYGSTERTDCEECGDHICTECSGDTCSYCGLCYDNHTEECWSCGEPCGCLCDREYRCPDCDVCENVMERCFTCHALCSCVCEEERCWDCGLCPTSAEDIYGQASCDDCGMCPCSCICDPPMSVQAAVANQTMMLLQVYVQDYFDFVENAPVSLMYLDENGEVCYKNCGLTSLHGDDDIPFINVYVPETEADKYFGIRVGANYSILTGGTDDSGKAYDLVAVYDEVERESVAYRCYPTEGIGSHEFDWSYGPHKVTLQLSNRVGYVGDMDLAYGRGMITLALWPAFTETIDEWIKFGETGLYPVNSQLFYPAKDPSVKDATITLRGKLTGYNRTFRGFNDLLRAYKYDTENDSTPARGLVVTLPEDIYDITVVCEGYTVYSTKLHLYNREDQELPSVSAKYVSTGDFRQDDNLFRQMFTESNGGNWYYEQEIANLLPRYDMNEDVEFLFINLKKSSTDTLRVNINTSNHYSNLDAVISVKRLGAHDRQAYRLPLTSEDGVYFYGLPKGNYVISATDSTGMLYTTELYTQDKADKNGVVDVNDVTLTSTSLQGTVRFQFYSEDPDFEPMSVLYTVKDDKDRIWYVGSADRSKYYASSEPWDGNPTEVRVALPTASRGEKLTITAVAVEQSKTVNGVRPDMKMQIANGIHGSASFAVAHDRTLTVPVRMDKLDYGTLQARVVAETLEGYQDASYKNASAKIVYQLYSESLDQVSANPNSFTPLMKITSVPPDYGKTLVQLRADDGTLLDEYAERGLKAGEVERPAEGDFRSTVDFGEVAPGTYTLRVSSGGFTDKALNGVNFYEQVTVDENQDALANVVVTQGRGVICFEQEYTVLDENGDPIQNAEVTVVRNDSTGSAAFMDKYVTDSQGKVTATIVMADPQGVSGAYDHTVYCYANGYKAEGAELVSTTVGGSIVRGYPMAAFDADTTGGLEGSFFEYTNLGSIWNSGTYYSAALLTQLGNNYYDLISSETMIELNDGLSVDEYSDLVTERNALRNLTVSGRLLQMSSMEPQNVLAYTIPMNDEEYTVSVPADTTLELHLEADGGTMTYNWYRKATQDGEWTAVEDFEATYYTGVLIFDPVNLTDHPGYYYCEVENSAGSATSATLHVFVESIPLKGVPSILGEPAIGKEVTANPNVFEKNYPDPIWQYQWQTKDGSDYVDIPDATEATYLLPVEELGSEYRVIVTSGSYEGTLTSRSITSAKGVNDENPGSFGCSIDHEDRSITLNAATGLRAGREYVISVLGELPDWSTAVKCEDENTPIVFSGLIADETYAVYCRFYETDLLQAGSFIQSQPRLYVGESVIPTHASFHGDTEIRLDSNRNISYEVPVVEVGLGETVYVDYFVSPANYTYDYYPVHFRPFSLDSAGISSSDITVEKVGSQLKITSTGTETGTVYIGAYRNEGGLTGSSYQIPIHEKNVNQVADNLYMNLMVKVGVLKTKTVQIEPGMAGVPIDTVDLSDYVLSGTAPYKFEVIFGSPSWMTISSDGTVSGTRNTAEDTVPATVKVGVTDAAARSAVLEIQVGSVIYDDGKVDTWADVVDIVRPSPGQPPAGIRTHSIQSYCDESATVVEWYELSANGEKVKNDDGIVKAALSSTDAFKANTKYQLEITLTARSGYRFMLNDSSTETDYAWINDAYVDYFYPNGASGDFTKLTMYRVYDTKNCITDVEVYDLLYPLSGKTADTAALVADSEKYTIENIEWSQALDANGCFVSGKNYGVEVTLKAKDGCWFATDDTAENAKTSAPVISGDTAYNWYTPYWEFDGLVDPGYRSQEVLMADANVDIATDGSAVMLYGYQLRDGEYLPSGGNRTTTEEPDGGYAYYDAATQTLTLNNFESGKVSDYGAITAYGDLTVELIGVNSLSYSAPVGFHAADEVTFTGNGSLKLETISTDNVAGIWCDALTVKSGQVQVIATGAAVWLTNPDAADDLTMSGGELSLKSNSAYDPALYNEPGDEMDLVVNGGCLTMIGSAYASDWYALSGNVNALGSPNTNGSEAVEGWNGVVASGTANSYRYIQLAHTSYDVPRFITHPSNCIDATCTDGGTMVLFSAEMNMDDARYYWEMFEPSMSMWFVVEDMVDMGILSASGYNSPNLRVKCAGFDSLKFRCVGVTDGTKHYSGTATMSLSHTYDSCVLISGNAVSHYQVCSVCGCRRLQAHSKYWTVVDYATSSATGIREYSCADCGMLGSEPYSYADPATKMPLYLDPNYEGAAVYTYTFAPNNDNWISYKPLRDGYRLLGWAYRPEAKVPVFLPSETYHLSSELAGKTLYAVWDHGISQVDVLVSEPIAGAVPDHNYAALKNAEGMTVSSPIWTNITGGAPVYMKAGEIFEPGQTYRVEVHVWVTDDYLINSDAAVTLNGQTPGLGAISADRDMVRVAGTWTVEKEQIEHVDITVVSPKTDAAPVLRANIYTDCNGDPLDRYAMAFYQPADSGSMVEVGTDETFVSGKICRLIAEILLENFYEFSDELAVTVNGADCTNVTVDNDSGKLTVQYDWDKLPEKLPSVNGTVTADGVATIEVLNLSDGQDATVMVAQYRDDQMLDVKSTTISEDSTFTLSGFSHQTNDIYKAFLLAGDSLIPLCAAEYLLFN